jgi:hypothetical protein
MDTPTNATYSGKSSERPAIVIVNLMTEQITHVLVKEHHAPAISPLMPPEFIEESAPDQIHLRRAWAELEHMDPLIETEFVEVQFPQCNSDQLMVWPVTAS